MGKETLKFYNNTIFSITKLARALSKDHEAGPLLLLSTFFQGTEKKNILSWRCCSFLTGTNGCLGSEWY